MTGIQGLRLGTAIATIGLLLAGTAPAAATSLTVAVSGIESDDGEIGCALYRSADGFPMEPAKATQQWHPAEKRGVECRFDGLEPGAYALAVSHDFNGNRETDTNFVGIPKEPWGVSNNVRPFMRAPTFEEAQVRLDGNAPVEIGVEVAQ